MGLEGTMGGIRGIMGGIRGIIWGLGVGLVDYGQDEGDYLGLGA